jgi:hypothetical protein
MKTAMRHLIYFAYFGFVIAACGLTSVLAKDVPSSAEQLRSEFESAFKNKDISAIISLFCWDGMDRESKAMMSSMIAEEVTKSGTNITGVTLSPLPTNFQTTVSSFLPDWEGDHGTRGKYNIPVIGMIHVNYSDRGQYEELPYGKKGNAFYIAERIAYQVPGKALNVRVDNIPRSLTYTGYWVYAKEGKEISVIINDHTNEFRQGWGDYVKYCCVRRTSTNETPGFANFFEFRVTEDITNVIFESGQMTNEEPVVYEKK